MRKILLVVITFSLAFLAVFSLTSCGKKSDKLSGNVTIQEWLDKKGEGEDFTVTVKLVELVNPYYARVEDSTGSVLLFGLWEDGEPKAFAEKGIAVGDTIVVKNPLYNIFEDNIEMIEGVLVKKK